MTKHCNVQHWWELFLMFIWKIWSIRNLWTFEGVRADLMIACSKTLSLLGEFEAAQTRESGPLTASDAPSEQSWIPPVPGIFKLNIDAAVSKDGKVALGMVVRDQWGDVLMSGSKPLARQCSVIEAEAEAALFGVSYAYDAGFRKLEITTDCLPLLKLLESQSQERSPVQMIVFDTLDVISKLDSHVFSFFPRCCNKVADSIAKLSLSYIEERIWMEDCEFSVLPLVLADKVNSCQT
ncbi:uncharacterized protein LOC110730920 [Chenopodium quinoa]|uniref:uncharacterized protein LOC110730920 n=1 Tax=Chenopodium quinoa TaxID=63459 RepID=UPI000B778893|nr:uncharacterized protein LOC110730920 [Chenopodium quinoa]